MAHFLQSHGNMSKTTKIPFCKSAKGYQPTIARFCRPCASVSHFGDRDGVATPADMLSPVSGLCKGSEKEQSQFSGRAVNRCYGGEPWVLK